jgi:hypothetical protein
MSDLNLADCFEEVRKEAHQEYLKTWSIITEGAENNGEYSNELLYQVIENQQKIASDLSMLATLTSKLLKHVEAQTGTTLTF